MNGDGLASATRFLVLALGTLYELAAVGGLAVLVPVVVAAVIACSIALARPGAAAA